jgi:hypothetical protein
MMDEQGFGFLAQFFHRHDDGIRSKARACAFVHRLQDVGILIRGEYSGVARESAVPVSPYRE